MATHIASRKHKSLAQNEARWGKERYMETNNTNRTQQQIEQERIMNNLWTVARILDPAIQDND
jgi:hypothetical protein